jgi:Uma2 family endonuclease
LGNHDFESTTPHCELRSVTFSSESTRFPGIRSVRLPTAKERRLGLDKEFNSRDIVYMSVTAPELPRPKGAPPLENGARLSAEEFLRRYEAMPEVKKAELIQGIVYMAFPVSAEFHGLPDNILQTWLGLYCSATPGVEAASNSTLRLGPGDVPQPDIVMWILPECGGHARLDPRGYLTGVPELAVEVAASSSSIDAHKKREAYLKGGVQEYLLWRTEDHEVDWWFIDRGEYKQLSADAGGTLRSRVFPGLWLNRAALLARKRAELMKSLQPGLESGEHETFVQLLGPRK